MTDVREITGLPEFLDAIGSSRAVVDFARRHGCVPCQRLEPHFKAAASAPVLEDIDFYKVMLDEVNADLLHYAMDELGVLGTPTVIEFREGQIHNDILGRTAVALIKELSNG